MAGFPEKFIYFRSIEQRKQAAMKNFPKKFAKCTIVLDGTHVPFSFRGRNNSYENELKNYYFSHKINKLALNTQVRTKTTCILTNMKEIFLIFFKGCT